MIVKTQTPFELLSVHDSQRRLASAEMPAIVNKKISTSTGIKVQKSVRFSENVRCMETLHVNDYTDEERARSWYQRHESRKVKKEMASTAQLFASGAIKGDCDKFCFRGLENKTQFGGQRKRTSKMMAWAAVLDAQEDFADPVCIAVAYKLAVQQSSADMRAYEKGLQDHTDAQEANNQITQSRKRKSKVVGRSR